MLQKDDRKIGPKNSPKNDLVVQGSHGPMFQTSFYPVLSTFSGKVNTRTNILHNRHSIKLSCK